MPAGKIPTTCRRGALRRLPFHITQWEQRPTLIEDGAVHGRGHRRLKARSPVVRFFDQVSGERGTSGRWSAAIGRTTTPAVGWASNEAFAEFMGYRGESCAVLGGLRRSCGSPRTPRVPRMVNPPRHQDNQNARRRVRREHGDPVVGDGLRPTMARAFIIKDPHRNPTVPRRRLRRPREGRPAQIRRGRRPPRVPAEGGRPDRVALALDPQDRRPQARRTGASRTGGCSAARWRSTTSSTWARGARSSRTWGRTG